ncbi:STE3-domain-containing protein [Wallemia mellicola]|uniref:STE3-domain-containing protein n=1 Tax=Wallemia mellicola TaxID=1708541 RepID=A0AB74KHF9_9BASI|nr:hypothetical protein E3Q23_00564 [Wallemia mellicola]TIB90434.1 STE3-domain-containing protein [Wallemia mellicola]TIB92191.1 STE3-domain-containing protein [Wallemia mellicola]TIC01174.1 STE3-domain-containing protein [Wallemia mellicola]TIC25725.1 STE3-domain-containing protein [Wallemia mellicola]
MKKYGLTKSLAMTIFILTIVAAVVQLVVNLQANSGRLLPYKSWDQVHVKLSELNEHQLGANIASWLLPIITAIIFFFFFGFAEESRKEYVRCLLFCFPFLRARLQRSTIPNNGHVSTISSSPSQDYDDFDKLKDCSRGQSEEYELPVLRASYLESRKPT